MRFSANVSDFLVIMLNLCAYKENERGKDERGHGRDEGKEKKRRRERREKEERENEIAVWVRLYIWDIDAWSLLQLSFR